MKIEKGYEIPPARRKQLALEWGNIEHGDSVVVNDKAAANHVVRSFNEARSDMSRLKRFATRQKTFLDTETLEKKIRIFFVNRDQETEEEIAHIKKRLKIYEHPETEDRAPLPSELWAKIDQ